MYAGARVYTMRGTDVSWHACDCVVGVGGGGARAQDLFYGVVSTAGAFCAYAISVCRGTNLCSFRLEYLHLKFQRMNVDKLYFHLNIKLYEFHAVIVAQVVTLL